jgi:hypothetical protein
MTPRHASLLRNMGGLAAIWSGAWSSAQQMTGKDHTGLHVGLEPACPLDLP